jgi:hypothetical protein
MTGLGKLMAGFGKRQTAVFALGIFIAFPFGAPDTASAAPRHAGRHYAGHHHGWHGGRAYGYYGGGYGYGGGAGAAAAAGIVGGLVAGAVAAGAAAGAQPYYGGPNCWVENRSAWNGYQWVVQPVQVCP